MMQKKLKYDFIITILSTENIPMYQIKLDGVLIQVASY